MGDEKKGFELIRIALCGLDMGRNKNGRKRKVDD